MCWAPRAVSSQADEALTNQWHAIDWQKAHRSVRKLQVRIVKAEQEGKRGKVQALQRLLTSSFYAKALAVKRVTENQGRRTAGVDGKTWSTPNGKWEAIHSLKRSGYQPLPLKRVYIPKANGKLRPLSIPTMKDRAMQALHLLALSPIAECKADENSYGFRLERSCADAMEQCHKVLSKKWSARWVLDADIKSCFDTISHEWMLANIPMEKRMLKKWLKAGFMEKNQFYPTKQGTPQGGIASPTLANMVLDGLEQQVRNCSALKDHGKGRKSTVDRINLVRYCDDFIVTAKSREILEEKVKPAIESFLKERGLSFSEEKTRILSVEEGFDFLGQNVRKYNGILLIKPAKKNIQALKDKLKVIFAKMKAAPAWALIRTLNPILKGWAYYHHHIVAKETFSDVDEFVYAKLVRWMKRKHPNKSWKWKIRKYFLTSDGWRFHDTDREGKAVRLFRTQTVIIKRHVKVKGNANPFDPAWEMYFERRQEQKMQVRIKPKLRLLYRRQQGKCPVCQTKITTDTGWHTHHIQEKHLGGKWTANNLVLLHPNCHRQVHGQKRSVVQPQQPSNQAAVSFA